MKTLKTRFRAAFGLIVLAVALVAPVAAQCPPYEVSCSGGKSCSCSGTLSGSSCVYDQSCMRGGCCKGDDFEILLMAN